MPSAAMSCSMTRIGRVVRMYANPSFNSCIQCFGILFLRAETRIISNAIITAMYDVASMVKHHASPNFQISNPATAGPISRARLNML